MLDSIRDERRRDARGLSAASGAQGRRRVDASCWIGAEQTAWSGQRRDRNGYSAYSPDLPGCAGVGQGVEETEQDIREAIEFHVDSLRAEGCEVPRPTSRSSWVEVAA